MSRSGYTDDYDNVGRLNLYRANVRRTIAGKRGQSFLREMASALDAMPVKELVADDIIRDEEHICGIGSVAVARKLDVSSIDPYDQDAVAKAFGITPILAAEIAYQNDECGYCYENNRYRQETPAERWTRMRKWVADHITGETVYHG